jgi:hypothetical protein
LEEDWDMTGYYKYCPRCGGTLDFDYEFAANEYCTIYEYYCGDCFFISELPIFKVGTTLEVRDQDSGYMITYDNGGMGIQKPIPPIIERMEAMGRYLSSLDEVGQEPYNQLHPSGPDPVPEPQPIIVYDGMETISENSLRFYEDTGQRLYNIERGVNAISSNMIPIITGINSIRDDQIDIKQYMQSVSENTAELVRLNKNDINNTEMLEQLSGNIDKLNTRLTELSTYLGYFFAFMIFIMIVIIFKGCWKLIDKYLLNVTLR